jgi:hypothetical protein
VAQYGIFIGIDSWFQVNRERRAVPRLKHASLLIHTMASNDKVVWYSPIVLNKEGSFPCTHLRRIKRKTEVRCHGVQL